MKPDIYLPLLILCYYHHLILRSQQTINTAVWLLGSSTIKQTIRFRYDMSQKMSTLHMRTKARAIHMINWFIPSYVHEHTTYKTI